MVVESHQHALEHIHSVLRKQKRLGRCWRMVHFDAHPDLACPEFPARACYLPYEEFDDVRCESPEQPRYGSENEETESRQKKNLYELLDSTASGIAQWILPLVLAADLTEIYLIKPSCSDQLPMGKHRYNVGCYTGDTDQQRPESFVNLAEHAKMKVDWDTPYYWDDNSVVPTNELLLSKALTLNVLEVEEAKERAMGFSTPWHLDVCLDYFGCRNPFLDELEATSALYAASLVEIAKMAHRVAVLSDNYSDKWHQFIRCMQNVLDSWRCEQGFDAAFVQLEPFLKMETRQRAEQVKQHVLHEQEKAILGRNAVENLLLPHETVTEELVQRRVEGFCSYLKRRDNDIVPFLVTVSRSSNDGFTPPFVVDALQSQVLMTIHSTVCGCPRNKADDWKIPASYSDCCMSVSFDYGEWEGTTLG